MAVGILAVFCASFIVLVCQMSVNILPVCQTQVEILPVCQGSVKNFGSFSISVSYIKN